MPDKGTISRVCQTCGVAFFTREWTVKAGFGKFCGRACSASAQRTRVERACERCGSTFTAVPAEVAKGKGRYCRRACANAALVVPLMERVWQKIDVRATGECWPWTAKRHARGYGETADRGKDLRVSRLVLEEKLGRPLAPGMSALHACSNPPCCNPSHLFEGDHLANMAQRKAEGKYPTGADHHMVKRKAHVS